MQIVSSVNFIFLFLTDIGGRYGCEKLLNFQDAEEEGEFQAKSHLEPSFKQIHKRISVAGVFERRRARRFQARNVGRIDQTLFRGSNNRGGAARRGAARWPMHRCSYAALLSRLSVPAEYTKRKGRCESSSRCSLLLAGIGRCDISPLCLIIRRQSDGESRFDSTLLRSFDLFRRLISCFVEDVVVAISFASRGA